MSLTASYFVMASEDDKKNESIDPDHPEAKGLIHFYQTEAKEWKFVNQEQYDAQKDTLPGVCFATRHSIKTFLERVKRIRGNKATQDDLNDSSLPDLNKLIPQMQFDDAAVEHTSKTSSSGENIAAASPLYYSYSKINDREQKIFATEAEVNSGDHFWDMNPLIFFRVKKPAKAIDKLPLIDLAKHFKQASAYESVSLIVKIEKIDKQEI